MEFTDTTEFESLQELANENASVYMLISGISENELKRAEQEIKKRYNGAVNFEELTKIVYGG